MEEAGDEGDEGAGLEGLTGGARKWLDARAWKGLGARARKGLDARAWKGTGRDGPRLRWTPSPLVCHKY